VPDAAQPNEQPAEVLAGSIERLTFHNASNGFCVLRLKALGQRELVAVVGHAAEISAGEWVTVSGTRRSALGQSRRSLNPSRSA
jgi:exodeoxyribonuclease V alpha subunit